MPSPDQLIPNEQGLEAYFTQQIQRLVQPHFTKIFQRLGLLGAESWQIDFRIFSGGIGGELRVEDKVILVEQSLTHLRRVFSSVFTEGSPNTRECLDKIIIKLFRVLDSVEDLSPEIASRYAEIKDHITLFANSNHMNWSILFTGVFADYKKSPRFLPAEYQELIFKQCFLTSLSVDEQHQLFAKLAEQALPTITHELCHLFITQIIEEDPRFRPIISAASSAHDQLYLTLNADPDFADFRRNSTDRILNFQSDLQAAKALFKYNYEKSLRMVRFVPPELRIHYLFYLQYRAFNENLARALNQKLSGEVDSYGSDYFYYFGGFYFYSAAVPGITEIRNHLKMGNPEDWKKYISEVCEQLLAYSKILLSEQDRE